MACALKWPLAALRDCLTPAWPGVQVAAVARIASTNSALMERARAGDVAPRLLVAEAQTAGRGRAGHRWQTAPGGAALLFSLGVPLAPVRWDGLSLALGLVLAEALGPEVRIKWPNDLWWRERKLAGVLVETAGLPAPAAGRYVALGVGINLAPPPAGDYATPPAWLREQEPDAAAPDVLLRILPAVAAALQRFEAQGFAPFHARFDTRDALRGHTVRLPDGTAGTGCGVAADGALLAQTASGVQALRSATVGVRLASHSPETDS